MGELPPTDNERSGSKEAARKFFEEMEEKATGLLTSKRGNLKDLISAGGSAFRNIYNHLKELAQPRRPTEGEVYSTDVRNQGVCSACSAFAVTAAFETCAHRTGKSQVGLSGQAPLVLVNRTFSTVASTPSDWLAATVANPSTTCSGCWGESWRWLGIGLTWTAARGGRCRRTQV